MCIFSNNKSIALCLIMCKEQNIVSLMQCHQVVLNYKNAVVNVVFVLPRLAAGTNVPCERSYSRQWGFLLPGPSKGCTKCRREGRKTTGMAQIPGANEQGGQQSWELKPVEAFKMAQDQWLSNL